MTSNRYGDENANYVPALPQRGPARVVEVEPSQILPPSEPVRITTGYTDRARGFSLATAPLAASVGLVAALVGILGLQVPIASLTALLLALGGFCVTWLLAYLAHVLISPDGAVFFQVWAGWRYLRREQRERHRRYREGRDR
jgi:hypothetical protein